MAPVSNTRTALLLAALAAAALAASVEVHAQELCWVEGWKIDPGEYRVSSHGISYGTVFNQYTHNEYFWVHAGTDIDFYDVTDKSSFDADANPTVAYSIPSGSTCYEAYSFLIGDDMYTMHGNTPYCTCNWRPDAPCPSQLEVTIDGVSTKVSLSPNTNVAPDSVSPDLVGEAAIAKADESDGSPPEYACTPLVNPEEIAGKWCVTRRGACFFQTKYQNCLDAGAIGALVINRADATLTMGVQKIEEGFIHIMIGLTDGDMIIDAIEAGKDVTLKAGKGTGPDAPLPEYSAPDPLGVVNIYTGKRDLETSPFILADEAIHDYKRKLLYAIDVDGNTPKEHLVMNISTSEGGTYPVVGSFGTPSDDRADMQLFYQGDRVYLLETAAWDNKVYIYDLTDDPADPGSAISSMDFTVWCPENAGWAFGGSQIHPSGDYVYLTQGMRSAECGDFDGDGTTGDYVHEIWDISNPARPMFKGTFQIPEVETGAVTLNGGRWEWGPNGLTGISMTSSGFVLYDFSDPENPVVASEVYDPAENSNDFTKGVLGSRYGDDGFWYVYEQDGADGIHAEFHQLMAVPCDMPAYCTDFIV